MVPAAEHAGVERGGLLLDAPAGYAATERGGNAEVLSGLSARHGTWAARINFSDVQDVRGLMQSFWTMSNYVAVVRRPDGTLAKAWTEVDHEFNNWFHFLWTRDPTPGGTVATQYLSDGGSVFDATGYFEGGPSQSVPLQGPAEPGGEALPPYHCKLARNEAEVFPASPRLPAPRSSPARTPGWSTVTPCSDRDLGVNLLIRHDGKAIVFELQAAWEAASPDGTETDRYRLLMASQPYAPASPEDTGLPSQTMTARFSQYVTGGTLQGLRFEDRPLMRDHPMVVDWFYYSPDTTLDLDAVEAHVAQIRARGVTRLNTTDLPLHRPYTKPGGIPTWPHMQAEHDPAVFLEGPDTVAPGETVPIVGHYANRQGELRLVWRVREGRGSGFSGWRVVAEDVWFRHPISFPAAGADAFEVQLQAGEYPLPGDWTQPPEAYVSRTLTYAWDRTARRFRLAGSR